MALVQINLSSLYETMRKSMTISALLTWKRGNDLTPQPVDELPVDSIY